MGGAASHILVLPWSACAGQEPTILHNSLGCDASSHEGRATGGNTKNPDFTEVVRSRQSVAGRVYGTGGMR